MDGTATSLRVVNLCYSESEEAVDDLSRFAVGISPSPELHMEAPEKAFVTSNKVGFGGSRRGNPDNVPLSWFATVHRVAWQRRIGDSGNLQRLPQTDNPMLFGCKPEANGLARRRC
jgi:hypothetical protein